MSRRIPCWITQATWWLLSLYLSGGAACAGEWSLVWSDEFNHDGPPDTGKWSHEEGFIRNRELQYYTSSPANARVADGTLIIEARKERHQNASYNPNDKPGRRANWRRTREFADYTSASLITRGKASWRYGRIEVRAKLPTGRGMWPAIWLLGDDIGTVGWPACGEIDVMEYVGFDPDTIHANVHTRKYNHVQKTSKGAKIVIPKPYEDFHVYVVEWDANRITIFVDNKKYFCFVNEGTGTDAWPFDKKLYLILNIAVGGDWGGRHGIDDGIFPQRMTVDYVRVYQKTQT